LEKQMSFVEKEGLAIDQALHDFLVREAMPGTGVEPERFFKGLSSLVHDLAPKNRDLLAKRDRMQAELDAWYRKNGAPVDIAAYEAFLRDIGYIVPEGPAFAISTTNVDPEISRRSPARSSSFPVMNARYALNAANARWGSLYDALYGTDAISDDRRGREGQRLQPKRGEKVIAWVRASSSIRARASRLRPAHTTWKDVTSFSVEGRYAGNRAPEGARGRAEGCRPVRRVTSAKRRAPSHILLKSRTASTYRNRHRCRQNQIGARPMPAGHCRHRSWNRR
jgi:malate synthase